MTLSRENGQKTFIKMYISDTLRALMIRVESFETFWTRIHSDIEYIMGCIDHMCDFLAFSKILDSFDDRKSAEFWGLGIHE